MRRYTDKSEATVGLPLRALALFFGVLLVGVTLYATSARSAPLGKPVPVEGTLSDGVIKNGKVTVQNGQAFVSGTLKDTATLADGAT